MGTDGYNIDSDALRAHSRGSGTASLYFGQLANVVNTARVSDDCFGPIGEVFVGKYHESLQRCQDQATNAKTFMQGVSERAAQTAQAYQDSDDAVSRAFAELSSGPANLFTIGGADAESNQKGWFEQNAGYGSSWMSAASDISRAGSPPDIAIAAMSAREEQVALVKSPGKALFENGLGFLIAMVISPIVEFVLEPAIGDPEQMRSTGTGWSKIADWVKQAGEHEAQRAAATSAVWGGGAGDAFRAQMTEFSEGAAAFAKEIGKLQQFLDFAADLFDAFVETCIDILQELVIGLIIEWVAALAASAVSAGASVAAAWVATTGSVSYTGIRLATLVERLHAELLALVTKLPELLKLAGLTGTTSVGAATLGAVTGNGPGFVKEQAIKYAYNQREDPSTAEERQAAMNRGFTYE